MADSAGAKKLGKPTHHTDTGLPYVSPPLEVQKIIDAFDISLDSVRVYVSPIVADEKTASGLILPESAKGYNFHSGHVVAAGPEAVLILPLSKFHSGASCEYRLRPGDVVVWGKFAGAVTDRLDKGEKNLKLMNGHSGEGDIIGVISHGR